LDFHIQEREIRVSFDEYFGHGSRHLDRFHVVIFSIEFYAWVISLSATVRHFADRGRKEKKTFPKFLENGEADRGRSGTVR